MKIYIIIYHLNKFLLHHIIVKYICEVLLLCHIGNEFHIHVTLLWNAKWISGLTKVMIYHACANQHQKNVVLATPIQGPSRSRVVSYPVNCKKQKQTNLGCLGQPRALTAEQIKKTSL